MNRQVLRMLGVAWSPARSLGQCCGDCNGNGSVTVDEVVTATNNALEGCSGAIPCGRLPASGQTTSYGSGSDGDVRAGAALSYIDNGDGTITDHNTGLTWEKKDDSGGIHDKDNTYTWSTEAPPYTMNGTMVTQFLAALNRAPCFANRWLNCGAARGVGAGGARTRRGLATMSRWRRAGPCGYWLVLAVLAAPWLMPGGRALADTFQVTKTLDTRDGKCDADCSLREAIIAANAHPGSDTINVPAGTYVLTLTGAGEDAAATGDLDITDSSGELRLTGAGADVAIIDANTIDRVFQILPGATVIISGLTVRGGKVSDDADPEGDGPGGGILNLGTLTIIDSTLSGNRANDGGGVLSWDGSTVTIQNSTVMDNTALNDGGGIVNGGNLTITNSTLRENHGCGGGIFTYGTLTMTGSTLSSNFADGTDCQGGAIFIDEGTVEITNSTISDNSAGDLGGGIANGGQLTITNTTFRGNSAPNAGGGIYTDGHPILLRNTIFASGSAGGNCSSRASGGIVDGGHNLQWPGSDCGATIPSLDPRLDQAGLQDNGGPTQTIALLPGSPAINAGDESVCSAPPANNLDQRGYVRPGAGATRCSIGAYEHNAAPGSGFVVCDVSPNTGDNVGQFGDQSIDIFDVRAIFSAVQLDADVPADGTARFSAMDSVTVDTPPTCGGDATLDIFDVRQCFNVAQLGATNYMRTGTGSSCTSSTGTPASTCFTMTKYFPMSVGDSWTYNCSPLSEECEGNREDLQVLGRVMFNGQDVLKVGEPETDEPDYWDHKNAAFEWYGWGWPELAFPDSVKATFNPPLQILPSQMCVGEQHTHQAIGTVERIEDGEAGTCVSDDSVKVLVEKVTACPLVPAGLFSNCLQLSFQLDEYAKGDSVRDPNCTADDDTTIETWWLAKGAGPVKRVRSRLRSPLVTTWDLREATVGGLHYPLVPTPTPTPTAKPTPHFIDNGDGTITNVDTGLMWEKKSDDGTLHDKGMDFRWAGTCLRAPKYCQPDAAAKAACEAGTAPATVGCDTCNSVEGTCYLFNSAGTIWTWLNQVNAEGGSGFAGHNDWRIPKAGSYSYDLPPSELDSLLDPNGITRPFTYSPFNTRCAAGCTVLTCSCTQSGSHWSSTSSPVVPEAALEVNFQNNNLSAYNKSGRNYVRAVRGGA